jgi:hypothetical protein
MAARLALPRKGGFAGHHRLLPIALKKRIEGTPTRVSVQREAISQP